MEPCVSDDPPNGGSSSFPAVVAALRPHLERARTLGFLGPGPVDGQIVHALGFAAVAAASPTRFLDLGTGGGLPGLVLLAVWPGSEAMLLDSNERRTEFVGEAVAALGWQRRAHVVRARAEQVGRDPTMRGRLPLVVSRGFGPPPVVAECAAPLLALGGRLIVSEPPEAIERWPEEPLATLGLRPDAPVVAHEHRFQVLRQVDVCPDAFPRRVGIPAKRPLW